MYIYYELFFVVVMLPGHYSFEQTREEFVIVDPPPETDINPYVYLLSRAY